MERVKLSIRGHDFALKTDNPEKLEKVAAELQSKIKKMEEMAVSMSFTDVVMLVALEISEENYDSSRLVKEAEETVKKTQEIENKAYEDIKVVNDKNTALESEIAELKSSLTQAREELGALNAKYQNVDPEAEVKLIEENRVLSNKIKDAEAEIQKIQASESHAIEELVNADDKNKALESEITELKSSLSQAQDELTALKSQYENASSKADAELTEENAALIDKIKDLQKKNADLEESLAKLNADYEISQKKNQNFQNEEMDKLRTTVATYEKTFDEYATQRNGEVKALNDELNALRKKYADLSAQMNEIVNDGQLTL